MSKMWIDPPSGWQFGFPKLYDPDEGLTVDEWLTREGYPDNIERTYMRCWTQPLEDPA